jgi:hypothetical protein
LGTNALFSPPNHPLRQYESALYGSCMVVLPVVGVTIGVVVMALGFRKREQMSSSMGAVDGVLKQDWTRTGHIDFLVSQLDSASPQTMTLRVQEMKITENAMGQDVTELRWRPAALEEAKEVVACWNARRPQTRLTVPN